MTSTTKPSGTSPADEAATPRKIPAVVTTVIITVAVMALLAGTVLFAVFWNKNRAEIDKREQAAADRSHAEKVAADYATGASSFDYRDMGPWRTALVKGVSPEVKAKLDLSAGALNQLMQPLQWVSKAEFLDSTVKSENGNIYTVGAYMNITTSTVQSPDQAPRMTAFTITIDKSQDWLITEVGDALGQLPVNGGTSDPAPQPAPGAAQPAPETPQPAPAAPR